MPPTPMELALTPEDTEMTAARAEPIIPQTNGNPYFRLTPKEDGRFRNTEVAGNAGWNIDLLSTFVHFLHDVHGENCRALSNLG